MADEIQKLKTDIASGRVLILIGASVSVHTTNGEQEVAHWKGLIKHGLQRCHQSGSLTDEIFHHINTKFNGHTASIDDYLFTADLIKGCLQGESNITHEDVYRSWLFDTLGKLMPKKPELICAIGELACPILTTNYDFLLTHILQRQPITWEEYCTENNDHSAEFMRNSILHLHGHLEQPDSIIFSGDDFEQFYTNSSYLSKWKSLIDTKSLLLLGYDWGITDPHLYNLLKWIFQPTDQKPPSVYKLVRSSSHQQFTTTFDVSFSEHIKEIQYGRTSEDLLSFIRSLKSFTYILSNNVFLSNREENIRMKYLTYLLQEYGHVSIFGHSNENINLPLESVFVELKFDPTHPSIKAMQTLELHEEFKRKLLSNGFFDENERRKIVTGLTERSLVGSEINYRDFMVDQWLAVFLNNRDIFTTTEATAIRAKINRLKQRILEKNNFQQTIQYRIQRAYQEFKHFIILGHPGSGKTTLSKWLVINMAKQWLGQENKLFIQSTSVQKKIPILIPIWKYVDQAKQNDDQHKKSLIQFISENSTFNSPYFDQEERKELSSLIVESLVQGNVLVIFEGLDEVPAHVDRSDLMKEINMLLERGIDYDHESQKLTYSIYEHKEINNIKDPHSGNRFIITSRIEGNYFEDINFYIPRLTIENMSNEALKLFCSSYMQCIRQTSNDPDQLYKDISQNKDIFQLAINPQLASVIAGLYHQCEGRLPEKRIDLYETAIRTMIDRLVISTSYLSTEVDLTSTMLWSILQEIAEYLHSKVEGLSERVLQQIIRQCLIEHQDKSSSIDDLLLKLVDMFKYQAGLLNEFGHNSFRFIHRTFQEYLAAKSLIYWNGKERSEENIYENIIGKIGVPNWRVPLSMAFGILSKLSDHKDLFHNILNRLLVNERPSINMEFSTLLVALIITDSLNDVYFASKHRECQLIRNLADWLLMDYTNTSGFARLKEHQELIHSYFLKLKQKYDETMTDWLFAMLSNPKNIAACANIAYQLKWYKPEFHEIFLHNLHNDSVFWNWPIDSILQYYSREVKDERITEKLICKKLLVGKQKVIKTIQGDQDWLCLITALYGGNRNYNSPSSVSEYYEIAQFISLTDKERMPFLLYYEEIWGKENAAYSMEVFLDTKVHTDNWKILPIFEVNEIYKESFLTKRILDLLCDGKEATELIKWLRIEICDQKLSLNEKLDSFIALIVLGEFDFVSALLKTSERTFIKSLANRVEQLIDVLKDPVARCSSHIITYLFAIYNRIKRSGANYAIQLIDYCRTYLSLMGNSGGLPVKTENLAKVVKNVELKSYLYAEHWALKFTGGKDGLIDQNSFVTLEFKESDRGVRMIESFLQISQATQIYKPVPLYAWPLDTFVFHEMKKTDIPIAFFNCLENMNTKVTDSIPLICDIFIEEQYFTINPDLILPIILLQMGIMSKDLNSSRIYKTLLPELAKQSNKKEFLLEKIQSISDPYYKSRALYQLAQLYDQKSYQLLYNSFILTREIPQAALKFQGLEKIFSAVHYKNVEERSLIQQIVNELDVTLDRIKDRYDQVIASTRLSFYGSGQFRYRYLSHALKTLMRMDRNNQQIQLIIKLKPLIALFDDLRITLNNYINNLPNQIHQYLARCQYGRILFTQKLSSDRMQSLIPQAKHLKKGNEKKPSYYKYNQLRGLFSLYAQLNDIKSMIGETETLEQLWNNLFRNPHNQSNVTKVLEIGLKTELFLTPQVAIIFDELIQQGHEGCITVLFPYIIKPPNEVLPVVQRWFTEHQNQPIGTLAALLLAENKHIFESAVDTIVKLLQSDNDQMRYRAQRVFQHPERDVKEPSKRASMIGERTLMKILRNLQMKEDPVRVLAYLQSFFYDLRWDDPQVFRNLYEKFDQLPQSNDNNNDQKLSFFHRMTFITVEVWNTLMEILKESPHPSYIERAFQSILMLTKYGQITVDNWNDFRNILTVTDTSRFSEPIYFTHTDTERTKLMLNEICTLSNTNDEPCFEILESKFLSKLSRKVDTLSRYNYQQIKHIGSCNFYVSPGLNQTLLKTLNNFSINIIILHNLIKWLIQKLNHFTGFNDTRYSIIMCDSLLSLTAACVQKEDYLYRKITNAPHFNKPHLIRLLQRAVHKHSYFAARGSAFILLAALDQTDHKVIIDAMNTLFDENLVKEYAMIGIPLIHLSPNELLDDLLLSLTSDSAVKSYEILKIFTQFALNEQIDASGKSKIINYLANEIGQLKSKKPINYYYTDLKIPFTTTLENELYKAWIKIQGLSGKTQYASRLDRSA